ncbi:hypothetical protein TWF173_007176 [Orbilia oligospora]|uniref:Uncharacterized protein n=1 Tax=Orbilia oligospora TaxID=2813651 RepID=A0A7C8RAV0_ORBOL|nr:hypothetical protein TWF970_001716 [Orbilia oligospora]KAF3312374.1 hypothetical protein TWF173_007176 [Orbilia oligospora]
MLLSTWNAFVTAGSSLVLGFTLLIPHTNAQAPTAVVNVVFDQDYRDGSQCVQSALWYNGGFGRGGDDPEFKDLGIELGCGRYAKNECYCEPKAVATATNFISSFVQSCQTTSAADLSSAMSIYRRYCSQVNVVRAQQTTMATLSSRDNAEPSTVYADSGLSQAAKIALGLGLGLGLTVLLFLAGIFFCLWKRGRRDSTATIGVVEHTPKQ